MQPRDQNAMNRPFHIWQNVIISDFVHQHFGAPIFNFQIRFRLFNAVLHCLSFKNRYWLFNIRWERIFAHQTLPYDPFVMHSGISTISIIPQMHCSRREIIQPFFQCSRIFVLFNMKYKRMNPYANGPMIELEQSWHMISSSDIIHEHCECTTQKWANYQ